MDIRLQSLLQGSQGWGHAQGTRIRTIIQARIDACPHEMIIRISLEGTTCIDVPFARICLIDLARSLQGRRGICLVHASSQDILDNIEGAACVAGYPLFAWNTHGQHHLLGPEPSIGLRAMLQHVLSLSVTRAASAATALDLRLPNASNKLKQLWLEGYILRREESAVSGGVEYEYLCIA